MKTYPILVSLLAGAGALTALGQDMNNTAANTPPPPQAQTAPADQYPTQAQDQARVQAPNDNSNRYSSTTTTTTASSNYQTQYQSKAMIALDVPGEISALQSTPFDNRETVISDVRKHVGQAQRGVLKLRFKNDVKFHHPVGDMRAEYDTALADEKNAKKDVDARIKEAHATNDAQSWDHARAELANSYQRFADAIGHVDAIATGHYDSVAVTQTDTR